MALTEDEITPGAAYRVRCHGKNFATQVANVKAIASGKITNAEFDRESGTWAVTLGPNVSFANMLRLKGALRAGAEVVRDGEFLESGEGPVASPAAHAPRAASHRGEFIVLHGRAGRARKSCITGGNCSSFGDGSSCGGHDCDGW